MTRYRPTPEPAPGPARVESVTTGQDVAGLVRDQADAMLLGAAFAAQPDAPRDVTAPELVSLVAHLARTPAQLGGLAHRALTAARMVWRRTCK